MKIKLKWFQKYREVKVQEVTAATAWDMDYRKNKRFQDEYEK